MLFKNTSLSLSLLIIVGPGYTWTAMLYLHYRNLFLPQKGYFSSMTLARAPHAAAKGLVVGKGASVGRLSDVSIPEELMSDVQDHVMG